MLRGPRCVSFSGVVDIRGIGLVVRSKNTTPQQKPSAAHELARINIQPRNCVVPVSPAQPHSVRSSAAAAARQSTRQSAPKTGTRSTEWAAAIDVSRYACLLCAESVQADPAPSQCTEIVKLGGWAHLLDAWYPAVVALQFGKEFFLQLRKAVGGKKAGAGCNLAVVRCWCPRLPVGSTGGPPATRDSRRRFAGREPGR